MGKRDLTLNFQKVFDTYAKANERVWEHDRTLTIGASEIGACLRKTFFTKRGAELKIERDPDYVQSYGATTRGSLAEAHYVVPALLHGTPPGAELLFAGSDQRTLILDRLSATPDGLMRGLPKDALADYGIDDIEADCVAIEIKTFDSRIQLDEPKPVHVWQVQQQMGLIHETTNHRPEYAVILYVNASWFDDIRPFVIKRDPDTYGACKGRSKIIYSETNPAKIPAEGKLTGGKDCQYCEFTNACAFATIGAVPTEKRTGRFTETEEAEITNLIRAERKLAAEEKDTKARKAAAGETIKEWLRAHETKFASAPGGFSASYNAIPGRKTVDVKAMAADGIDLTPYEKQGPGSDRLTVKAPGSTDED